MPGIMPDPEDEEQALTGILGAGYGPTAVQGAGLARQIVPPLVTGTAAPSVPGANTYYHGTNTDFAQPRPGEYGIWLTKNANDAARYANISSRYGGAPKVLPFNINIGNPAMPKDVASAERAVSTKGYASTKLIAQELHQRGFDSWQDGDSILIFDPSRLVRSPP